VIQFPLPIFIPPISPQSPSPIIRGWYSRPVSGRSTQSPTAQIKKKRLFPFTLLIFASYTVLCYTHNVSLTSTLQSQGRQVAKFFFGNSWEVIAISPGSFLSTNRLCRKQFREFPLLPVVCPCDKLPAATENLQTALVGERPYFCCK
jgi:hypothetical protein